MNKLNKTLEKLENNFIIFGIKTSTDANAFAEIRKNMRFYVEKKTLLRRALKERKIDFDVTNISKNNQLICILKTEENKSLNSYSSLISNKNTRKKIAIHFLSILNTNIKDSTLLKNFHTTSLLYANSEDKKKFLLQNISKVFSDSMRLFLLLLEKIENKN